MDQVFYIPEELIEFIGLHIKFSIFPLTAQAIMGSVIAETIKEKSHCAQIGIAECISPAEEIQGIIEISDVKIHAVKHIAVSPENAGCMHDGNCQKFSKLTAGLHDSGNKIIFGETISKDFFFFQFGEEILIEKRRPD